jgi:hypothetical protein
VDKEYTQSEAKAWLAGYDAGKKFAKKEWLGLTEEEKKTIYRETDAGDWVDQEVLNAVAAKLREKNA